MNLKKAVYKSEICGVYSVYYMFTPVDLTIRFPFDPETYKCIYPHHNLGMILTSVLLWKSNICVVNKPCNIFLYNLWRSKLTQD